MRNWIQLFGLIVTLSIFIQCKPNQKEEHGIEQLAQIKKDSDLTSSIAESKGKAIYNSKCLNCHQIGNEAVNVSGRGPHLNNLINRKLGAVEGFRYSKSFEKANEMNLTWNRHNLLQFVQEPENYIQKVINDDNAHTRMIYKVQRPEERAQIVEYINSQTDIEIVSEQFNTSNAKCLTDPKPKADFSECNLAGVDFSDADLRGANLQNTNFLGANLSGANLSGADLTGALLSGADLTKVNFESANLSKASMIKASLGKTNFNNAIFEGATWVNGQSCAPGSVGKCNY